MRSMIMLIMTSFCPIKTFVEFRVSHRLSYQDRLHVKTEPHIINTHSHAETHPAQPLQPINNQQWACSQRLKINSPNPPPLTTFHLPPLQSLWVPAQYSVTANNEESIWDHGSPSNNGSVLTFSEVPNLRGKVTMTWLVGTTQRGS